MSDYRSFLEQKVCLAQPLGFAVDPAEINPALKPHIRAIVPWMLHGGRRALFASFGMQKTTAHLECMRLVQKKLGGPTLIILPLGARLSFFHDAQKYFSGDFAISLRFIRENDDIRHCDLTDGSLDYAAPADMPIYLTNFESVREGKVDPALFRAASIDEGDILRGFGGTKTFREFMRVSDPIQLLAKCEDAHDAWAKAQIAFKAEPSNERLDHLLWCFKLFYFRFAGRGGAEIAIERERQRWVAWWSRPEASRARG